MVIDFICGENMKISEQVWLEREFPFYLHNEKGEKEKTENVRIKELPASVIVDLRRKSIINGKVDEIKLAHLTTAKMIVEAPFEDEDNTVWKDMNEEAKVKFLLGLSVSYTSQLSNIMREIHPQITKEERNL